MFVCAGVEKREPRIKNLRCAGYVVSKGACCLHYSSTTMRVGCSSGMGSGDQQSYENGPNPGTEDTSASACPEQASLLSHSLSFNPGLQMVLTKFLKKEELNAQMFLLISDILRTCSSISLGLIEGIKEILI